MNKIFKPWEADGRRVKPQMRRKLSMASMLGLADRVIGASFRAENNIIRDYLTIDEAAVFMRCGAEEINQLVCQGKLPAYQPIPGKLLIERRALQEYIHTCRYVLTNPFTKGE